MNIEDSGCFQGRNPEKVEREEKFFASWAPWAFIVCGILFIASQIPKLFQ